MHNQNLNQWIVEEFDPENFHDRIIASFATYEEAYSFYKSKCQENPSVGLSMRRVERQLLQE